jgi:RNA polymerase sigma-70 factor (ECF subfamily)
MTGSTDDLSLIAECRAGRTDAFGVLVQRYQDRLYPTALRLTGGTEDALDLLQDAFFQSFRKLGSFHGESSFYTWVYRIVVNLALSAKRRRTPKLFRDPGSGADFDPAETSASSDPSSNLERVEREAMVQQALDRLAPDHRVVIVMKEFDGMHYEEIAATLGVPIGTVRSRLHRARSELKELLSGFDDDPADRPGPIDPSTASSLIPHAEARGR